MTFLALALQSQQQNCPHDGELSYGSEGLVPADSTTDRKEQPQSSGAEVEV